MPKRGNKQDGEPLPDRNKRLGIPFVPQTWPTEAQFKASFDKVAELRRQRQTVPDEDGPRLSSRPSRRLIINS